MSQERCPEWINNPFGNRKGRCTCVLPAGHVGDHQCQSKSWHTWAGERPKIQPARPGPCRGCAGTGTVYESQNDVLA